MSAMFYSMAIGTCVVSAFILCAEKKPYLGAICFVFALALSLFGAWIY